MRGLAPPSAKALTLQAVASAAWAFGPSKESGGPLAGSMLGLVHNSFEMLHFSVIKGIYVYAEALSFWFARPASRLSLSLDN